MEKIFFAPSTGLSFSILGMMGSRVKRNPIWAALAAMAMTAATATKMKECLKMTMEVRAMACLVASKGLPSRRPPM